MKKWSEIKEAVWHKLFIDPDVDPIDNYARAFQTLANECLVLIATGVMPKVSTVDITTTQDNVVVTMPEDFISYLNRFEQLSDSSVDVCFTFVGRNKLKVEKAGTYRVYYNAYWPAIEQSHINEDSVLQIDLAVLNCLPTYMASQVLAQDDIQRSMILKNEFELLVSRLDNGVLYNAESFDNDGGWY